MCKSGATGRSRSCARPRIGRRQIRTRYKPVLLRFANGWPGLSTDAKPRRSAKMLRGQAGASPLNALCNRNFASPGHPCLTYDGWPGLSMEAKPRRSAKMLRGQAGAYPLNALCNRNFASPGHPCPDRYFLTYGSAPGRRWPRFSITTTSLRRARAMSHTSIEQSASSCICTPRRKDSQR
jgi:hypothetical protein